MEGGCERTSKRSSLPQIVVLAPPLVLDPSALPAPMVLLPHPRHVVCHASLAAGVMLGAAFTGAAYRCALLPGALATEPCVGHDDQVGFTSRAPEARMLIHVRSLAPSVYNGRAHVTAWPIWPTTHRSRPNG